MKAGNRDIEHPLRLLAVIALCTGCVSTPGSVFADDDDGVMPTSTSIGEAGVGGPVDTMETTGDSPDTTSTGGETTTGTTTGDSTSTGDEATTGSTGEPPDMCSAPECGSDELCADRLVALDDDCDGEVDEGCACTFGQAQGCFLGDPSALDDPGCLAGTQRCTAAGTWGPCEGGLHAVDGCSTPGDCAPVTALPFVPTDLHAGTGTFSDDAMSESWSVTCPAGVDPCPTVVGDSYAALQSGEYLVTYDKTTAMGMDTCQYPLRVAAPGLRVELDWEWPLGMGNTTDLDVQVHRPDDTSPWGGPGGNDDVCTWTNCTAGAYAFGGGVEWFNGMAPPDPVPWWLEPVFEDNSCYFAPNGVGATWQSIGMGCHNPRIDGDNIFCDPAVWDEQASDFCRPENINIDFPPVGDWTRVAVNYFSSHGATYDVHPRVRVFCAGQLAGELGPSGYDAPVTFAPADSGSAFWLAGDVRVVEDECGDFRCEVVPLHADPMAQTPLVVSPFEAEFSFGPPYPPF